MRNYWIRIGASALGIFVVGMILISAVRGVRHKVTSTINSSDPIPIPLIGMVPFRLDSEKLGSLSRLEFLRSDPQHISGIRVLVKLDSGNVTRLQNCVIALDDVDNIGEHTTFRCQAPGADAAGLEPFGTVVVRGMGDSFPLLLPAKAIADLRETSFRVDGKGIEITSGDDRRRAALAERMGALRDEVDTRMEARSDSVDNLRELADLLEDSASAAQPSQRRAYQVRADSARASMRLVVDRMRADESQLEAMDRMEGLSAEEIDSISQQGRQIADSVNRIVARELQRVQVELQKMHDANRHREGARVEVTAPVERTAPVPPPPPAQPPKP